MTFSIPKFSFTTIPNPVEIIEAQIKAAIQKMIDALENTAFLGEFFNEGNETNATLASNPEGHTNGPDRIVGTDMGETLAGGAGNDTILGLDGDDILLGGIGDDSMDGGTGHDLLLGGTGVDFMDGGSGNDSMDGGADNDLMGGREGDDIMYGGSGNDALFGGAGHDQVYGGDGQDYLRGSLGNDTLDGGAGNDEMRGDSGADTFVFDFDHGAQTDKIKDFQAGEDHLDFGDGMAQLATSEQRGDSIWFYSEDGSESASITSGSGGAVFEHFDSNTRILMEGVDLTNLTASDFFG